MHCHLEHVVVPVSIGRIYQPGLSYENRDPYDVAFIVKWLASHHAEVAAMDKLPTKEQTRAIRQALIENGVELLRKERNGRIIDRPLPLGSRRFSSHPKFEE